MISCNLTPVIFHWKPLTIYVSTQYTLVFTRLFKYFIFDLEQERLKPIPLNEFHAHVMKMHENRDYGFEDEYQVRATH